MVLGLGAPNPDSAPEVLDPKHTKIAAEAREKTIKRIEQLAESCQRRRRRSPLPSR